MSVGVIFLHLPLVKWQPRAEVEVAPFVMRWRMRRTKSDLGHRMVYLEVPWSITLPHTPLFCVVNMRVAKVATLIAASLAVDPLMRHFPQRRTASQRRKGVESDFVPVHSPGQRRKKKARVIIFQVACMRELLVAAKITAM